MELTCLRLIDKVSEGLGRLSTLKTEMDQMEEQEEGYNGDKTSNSENDELIEKLLIEEFGNCLAEIIDSAEKRNIFSN